MSNTDQTQEENELSIYAPDYEINPKPEVKPSKTRSGAKAIGIFFLIAAVAFVILAIYMVV